MYLTKKGEPTIKKMRDKKSIHGTRRLFRQLLKRVDE